MIAIVERKPTVAEYESIVASVGFRRHEIAAVEIALANTVFAVCAVEEQEVVGVGRIVGDGAISFLLTNIMVRPSHQRRGIGTRIVQSLCGLMETLPYKNMVLEVVALPELQRFYERVGFKASHNAPPGMVRWFNRIDITNESAELIARPLDAVGR
jgi:GNAT superfamily N-acetyltransferase